MGRSPGIRRIHTRVGHGRRGGNESRQGRGRCGQQPQVAGQIQRLQHGQREGRRATNLRRVETVVEKEASVAERLALGVIPCVGWSAKEIQTIAREAEEAGFDAIFAAEVNNDVMATAQLMVAATRRIQVGTWIANIYLRHSYVCAQGAALIADESDW